jgi:hypothetical protein
VGALGAVLVLQRVHLLPAVRAGAASRRGLLRLVHLRQRHQRARDALERPPRRAQRSAVLLRAWAADRRLLLLLLAVRDGGRRRRGRGRMSVHSECVSGA